MPIPVAARPKAMVYGHSLTGTTGSNSAGGMDVCLCKCCVLSGRGLCEGPITRPEESYRVWCVELSVIEEPHRRGLGLLGSVEPWEKMYFDTLSTKHFKTLKTEYTSLNTAKAIHFKYKIYFKNSDFNTNMKAFPWSKKLPCRQSISITENLVQVQGY
jgi:hypothetical protein